MHSLTQSLTHGLTHKLRMTRLYNPSNAVGRAVAPFLPFPTTIFLANFRSSIIQVFVLACPGSGFKHSSGWGEGPVYSRYRLFLVLQVQTYSCTPSTDWLMHSRSKLVHDLYLEWLSCSSDTDWLKYSWYRLIHVLQIQIIPVIWVQTCPLYSDTV